ncbi:hypothetical protein [Paenibacillus planticolens]|uniref:Lipoprotein n=1 Tax=Paenibacillus planticolens TaxID=2654976 RepID=A0ABX1ZUX0_9BACL|nr:hypothetical protein [Paenibacillus planticolens]NOV03797.1 hypothetical protein [Paenibacillus planticolens]
MMKLLVFAALCLSILLVSCSSGNPATVREPASTAQPKVAAVLEPSVQPIQLLNIAPPIAEAFPQTVNLSFQPIQLSQLQVGKPQADWTSVRRLSFGAFQGKPIELTVYQKPKDEASLLPQELDIGMNLQGKTYLISNVSHDLLLDKAVNNIVVFNQTFSSGSKDYYFLGGVELFANGPGLMLYIVYDFSQKAWYTFDQWGSPSFKDLDADGQNEFVIEFQGMHLQLPDVTVIHMQNDNLQKSAPFADTLAEESSLSAGLSDYKNKIFVKLSKNLDPPSLEFYINDERFDSVLASYRYSQEKLERVK